MKKVGKPAILIGLMILFFVLPSFSQESWPADSAWRFMLDQNWNLMTDPPGDQNPGAVDVINNSVPTCSYFYASSTSLFFRMALADNPIQSGALRPYAWMAAIDVNGDGVLDWDIRAAGISEYLQTYCFLPPQNIGSPTLHWQVANPVAAGYVRAVNMGSFYYLDMQVPFTALQRSGFAYNVTLTTQIRMFYHTSTSEAVDIKDATVPTADFTAAFGFVTPTTPGGAPNSYGRIYDTRDPEPYTSGGSFSTFETVTLSGNGWPPSTSSYYNNGVRSVRLKDPNGNVVWSGTVTTNSSGSFTNVPTWTIPDEGTSGIYTIEVMDPRVSGSWNPYDTFTVNIIQPQIYDTRDSGQWTVNETVTLSGANWPMEGTSSYNGGVRNVRIKDPDGNVVWSGTVTTNAQGAFTSTPSWTIPASAVTGTYNIEVEAPLAPGTWKSYDTFSVYLPVAVKLIAFTIQRENVSIVLRWTVAETNSFAGFVIERFENERWKKVASFADHEELAAGRSNYCFTDDEADCDDCRYRLSAVTLDGKVEILSTADLKEPREFSLLKVYPNPFNPSATISFSLAQEGAVELVVYDLRGRRVRTLLSGALAEGRHSIQWDACDDWGTPLSAGAYWIRLKAESVQTVKALIVR
ncbi:MAG: T9SS type A sorting domain-containing protein [candidate division KSB1 bacterium]|nr:T9SS type A sorting domain-containing protein [candidate division KSB1 bacterium]